MSTVEAKWRRSSMLFFDPCGPMVRYSVVGKCLEVSNLNPQVLTAWRMSRWEMLVFGLRCIVAAARPVRPRAR